MKTLMSFAISTTCPIDGETIPVAVAVEPTGFLKVEDLLEAARGITAEPVTQESLTQKLAAALGCRVATIGTHSGVRITCTAQGGQHMTETRSNKGGYSPRFDITRTDGQPIDPSRRYMVLSFDGSDPEAIRALRIYAMAKRGVNPELADDLLRHIDNPADAPAQHRWAL